MTSLPDFPDDGRLWEAGDPVEPLYATPRDASGSIVLVGGLTADDVELWCFNCDTDDADATVVLTREQAIELAEALLSAVDGLFKPAADVTPPDFASPGMTWPDDDAAGVK